MQELFGSRLLVHVMLWSLLGCEQAQEGGRLHCMGGATFTLHLGKASGGHRAAKRVPVSELGNTEIRGGGGN